MGEDPDSLNNSINKAREQLIESMRTDLKIEKSSSALLNKLLRKQSELV